MAGTSSSGEPAVLYKEVARERSRLANKRQNSITDLTNEFESITKKRTEKNDNSSITAHLVNAAVENNKVILEIGETLKETCKCLRKLLDVQSGKREKAKIKEADEEDFDIKNIAFLDDTPTENKQDSDSGFLEDPFYFDP